MGATSDLLRDAGDVRYLKVLISGRQPGTPASRGKPGSRLRIINADGDAFRVAAGGHRLTVTHTDGCRTHRSRPTRCSSSWVSGTASRSPSPTGYG